jgi:uncharacterized sulfatase
LWFFSSLVAVMFVGSACKAPPSATRPNILLIIADDWGRHASCYRDPLRPSVNDAIETPNIDRVAREGIVFRNAFYNVSSCTPSRASLVTGCYFWRLGRNALHQSPLWKHQTDPGWALPGFGAGLRPQNYFLGSWGKTLGWHWFPANRFSFDLDKLRYNRWVPTQPNRAAAQSEIEKMIRASVTEMLAKRKKNQPFFHVIGPIGAHRPFLKGSGQSLWGINPDGLKGKLPAFLPDLPEVRADMADTLGEVLVLDLYVGWIVDELERAGELDKTLLVLCGDNGPDLPRSKTQVYDLGMRAPLIMRWPAGIAKGGRVLDDFVSLMDLAPTFLEVGGVTPPPSMNGRSLLPLLKSDSSGQIDPARDFVVSGRERHSANVRGGLPYPVRALRTAQFLYVRNFKPERWPHGDPAESNFPGDPNLAHSAAGAWVLAHKDEPEGKTLFPLYYGKRPAEELYDLAHDPDQIKNVAEDAAFGEVKRTLSERLMKILRDTNDPRLTDTFDLPPYNLGPGPGKMHKEEEADENDPDCLHHANED